MSREEQPKLCPTCHGVIPADTPGGWCPRCALTGFLCAEAGGESGETLSLRDIPPPGASVSVIGDYELLEVIAHGGMGVVYKARQRALDRIVALKLLLGGVHAHPDYKNRFTKEARLVARLNHPNIVPVLETGIHDGQPFFSMEYVAGPNLPRLVEKQRFSSPQAVDFLVPIAEAVHHAHLQGIVHRDLKPSNILLGTDGRPRITDFGLAAQMDEGSGLTLSGTTIGTPGYLPPEQISAKRGEAGPHSDVYSLGAVLYYLLTGRPPFAGETLADTLEMVVRSKPVPPSKHNPEVTPELESICLRCLAKEPRKRPLSALELAESLRKCRIDHVRPRGWMRIGRPAAVSIALLTVAAAAIIPWQLSLRRNRERTSPLATVQRDVRELENDFSTLLLLHCNGILDGASGEKPESATGVTFEEGVIGEGAYFSRGNEVYFLTSNNVSVTNGTLEFWIRPRWNVRDGRSHGILSIGEAGGFVIGKDTADNWRLIFNRYGGHKGVPEGEVAFNTEWKSNEWHHMAIVWTSTACKAYVDANLINEVRNPYPPADVPVTVFQIGSDKQDSADAVLDEIRLSNRERTKEEIRQSFLRKPAASHGEPARLSMPGADEDKGNVATNGAYAPDGMIGWWAGHKGFADIRGTNNGVPFHGVTIEEGKVGAAFAFNSPGAAVRIPHDASLDFSKDSRFTLAVWARPQLNGQNQAIAVKAPPSDEWDWGVMLGYSGRFVAGNHGHTIISSKPALPGVWHHVAFTYNQGSWRLYQDGSAAGSLEGHAVTQSKGALAIGRKGDSALHADGFVGSIDELQIFNRALSPEEIVAIHAAGRRGLRPR